MSKNTILINASPDDVFDVLLDARMYPRWVVGAKHVRGVDDDWPAVGSRFHHRVGAGPIETADSTKILAVDRPRHLTLEVRFRPIGVGIVDLDVSPEWNGGSYVLMEEHPTAGPVHALRSKALDVATHLRNAVSLRRLRRLAERRARSRLAGAAR